jgi:hypothetical protein
MVVLEVEELALLVDGYHTGSLTRCSQLRSAPGPKNPARSRSCFLPKQQVQLRSMLLNVAHTIEL